MRHVCLSGGPRRSVKCRGSVKLGPLAPRRAYRVLATAIRLQKGRVVATSASPASSVYLPGDDGNWVRVP